MPAQAPAPIPAGYTSVACPVCGQPMVWASDPITGTQVKVEPADGDDGGLILAGTPAAPVAAMFSNPMPVPASGIPPTVWRPHRHGPDGKRQKQRGDDTTQTEGGR